MCYILLTSVFLFGDEYLLTVGSSSLDDSDAENCCALSYTFTEDAEICNITYEREEINILVFFRS